MEKVAGQTCQTQTYCKGLLETDLNGPCFPHLLLMQLSKAVAIRSVVPIVVSISEPSDRHRKKVMLLS